MIQRRNAARSGSSARLFADEAAPEVSDGFMPRAKLDPYQET